MSILQKQKSGNRGPLTIEELKLLTKQRMVSSSCVQYPPGMNNSPRIQDEIPVRKSPGPNTESILLKIHSVQDLKEMTRMRLKAGLSQIQSTQPNYLSINNSSLHSNPAVTTTYSQNQTDGQVLIHRRSQETKNRLQGYYDGNAAVIHSPRQNEHGMSCSTVSFVDERSTQPPFTNCSSEPSLSQNLSHYENFPINERSLINNRIHQNSIDSNTTTSNGTPEQKYSMQSTHSLVNDTGCHPYDSDEQNSLSASNHSFFSNTYREGCDVLSTCSTSPKSTTKIYGHINGTNRRTALHQYTNTWGDSNVTELLPTDPNWSRPPFNQSISTGSLKDGISSMVMDSMGLCHGYYFNFNNFEMNASEHEDQQLHFDVNKLLADEDFPESINDQSSKNLKHPSK